MTTTIGEFTPNFWDDLPQIFLTTESLRELNRRNRLVLKPRKPATDCTATAGINRFARRGGPSTSHLRGVFTADMMRDRSSGTEATKVRKLTTNDKHFDLALIQNNIFPLKYQAKGPEPANAKIIIEELRKPSNFSTADFEDFELLDDQTKSEAEVMSMVLPKLIGDLKSTSSAEDMRFVNLKTLTNDTTVPPKPDYCEGARLEDLHGAVRDELAQVICPTTRPDHPVATNFFIEAKWQDGKTSVALRQACIDGASGARAMYGLQNYALDNAHCDGNAYTMSVTYKERILIFYAHHVTIDPDTNDLYYHMTRLMSIPLFSEESFVKGVAALRNARDLVKTYRDDFIESANKRADNKATSKT